MPIYSPADAEPFDMHGSRFASYIRTDRGASTLCAWRLEVGPDQAGVRHRPSHEEVFLVLTGELAVTLDGETTSAGVGDVVHVPAGCELTVDSGPDGATAWVTTTAGLTATVGGETIAPPWAQ
jgi:quercetin dioxygenase-like cupin family protein